MICFWTAVFSRCFGILKFETNHPERLRNVGIAIINHPPFITICMGGIATIKHGWFIMVLYPHDQSLALRSGDDASKNLNLNIYGSWGSSPLSASKKQKFQPQRKVARLVVFGGLGEWITILEKWKKTSNFTGKVSCVYHTVRLRLMLFQFPKSNIKEVA